MKNESYVQYIALIGKYVPISVTDIHGIITCVSDAFCEMTGYVKQELIGQKHSLLRHYDTDDDVYVDMWSKISQGKAWYGRLKNRTKSEKTFWVDEYIEPLFEADEVSGYIAIQKNVTNEAAFEKLAKIDPLTGLFNRYAIEEFLHLFIEEAHRYETAFSVILIDLDDFKEVNDAHGHLVGDEVLKKFASIFGKMIRSSDCVGRWGGEEFLILLPHTPYEQAVELAERLRSQVNLYRFDHVGNKSASFGVALFEKEDSYASLINRADQALYTSKKNGKNRVS
ncbi:sensor domain-containing diguanylate cyclase [bacterium]|nr:sensor domain-containing diguanylate cyclase [bacterium]